MEINYYYYITRGQTLGISCRDIFWLVTCWSGAASYWSDPNLFCQKLVMTVVEEINRLLDYINSDVCGHNQIWS